MQVRENIHNLRPFLIGVVATLLALGILSPLIQPAVVKAQSSSSFYGLLQKLQAEAQDGNKVVVEVSLVANDGQFSVVGYVKIVGDDYACFRYRTGLAEEGRLSCVVFSKIVAIQEYDGDLEKAVLPQ